MTNLSEFFNHIFIIIYLLIICYQSIFVYDCFAFRENELKYTKGEILWCERDWIELKQNKGKSRYQTNKKPRLFRSYDLWVTCAVEFYLNYCLCFALNDDVSSSNAQLATMFIQLNKTTYLHFNDFSPSFVYLFMKMG